MDRRLRYTHAVDVIHEFQTFNAYYYLAVCFICFELLDCVLSRRRCCRRRRCRHTKQPLTSNAALVRNIGCRFHFQIFSVCFKSHIFSSDLSILHMDGGLVPIGKNIFKCRKCLRAFYSLTTDLFERKL